MTKPTKPAKTVTLVRVHARGEVCQGCALFHDGVPCGGDRPSDKRDPLYCGTNYQWRIAPSDGRDSKGGVS